MERMDKKRASLFAARTGILLALALVGQHVSGMISGGNNFVVGSWVNLMLFIAVMGVGVYGAGMIAISTPFIASFIGIASMNIVLVPFVAGANLLLVLVYFGLAYLIEKAKIEGNFAKIENKHYFMLGAILIAALAKGLFMWFGVTNIAYLLLPKVPPAMVLAFSYPQIITALIGGFIAYPVIVSLKKAKIF